MRTRRSVIFAAAAAPVSAPGAESHRVPTLDTELNGFAAAYNAYVMRLRDGRVDLDQWRRVVRAWRRMTNEEAR